MIDIEKIEKEERLQSAIDAIRTEFGFTSLLKGNALDQASRTIARSKLIGGHFSWRIRWAKMINRFLLYLFCLQESIKIVEWLSGWDSFLSEHSSSLWEEKNKDDISISLSMEEKVLFVRQLYTNVFPATFVF